MAPPAIDKRRQTIMFHMLSCFNLKPGIAVDAFCRSVAEFTSHLEKIELIHSAGSVGRRQRDTIMDTDSERHHEYFLVLSFLDRAQCDRAVEHMFSFEKPADTIHKAVYTQITDQVFICWEDIQGRADQSEPEPGRIVDPA
jgi:hypothetical protein